MASTVYANVIVDIQARELKDKLFTYRVPEELASETFIGAQVLVPFGARDQVGGYVVSLTDEPKTTVKIKAIAEVVEPEPLFDTAYVDFLYWVADYYCASLSDVISAAVPSALSAKFKRMVRLNQSVFDARGGAISSYEPACQAVIKTLQASKNLALSVVALKQRFRRVAKPKTPASQFYRAIALLKTDGIISVDQESTAAQSPKVVTMVSATGIEGKTQKQKEIIEILVKHGGAMSMKDLIAQSHSTAATIKKHAEAGFLSINHEESYRDPLANMHVEKTTNSEFSLTEAQRKALFVLSRELDAALTRPGQGMTFDAGADEYLPWLLHGVTGSGKTEVYLQLIEQTLKAGKAALMLVPEISLTPQLARRLKGRFGEQVSIWHSGISAGEKYDTWRRLKSGEGRVLLGARSAILANLPEVGLIILDEEHDGSYKQTSPSPRYNAKDVAIERGRRSGALVLLGSATPDVAVFARARASNKILELPERVFKQAMPVVNVIDMRHEFSNGNKSIFSRSLANDLTACLGRQEQAILLINRRGYASHVFCRACGFVVKCKNCSVALVFHQRLGTNRKPSYLAGFLACHHCGFRCQAMEECPSCKSPFIKQYGLGTQRVEEEVHERYPEARILRLDSDVTMRKGAHEEILQSFAQGDADVLIGTQMVSKGLDIANVTLVGVMTADAAFNLPDYRSTERGFQLLTQVSGRAGRGQRPGSVILQTYDCEMPALEWSRHHDYSSFVKDELEARQAFGYPPYSQIIRIVVAGDEPVTVEAACKKLGEETLSYLAEALPDGAVQVLGPAACLIERLRGKFRYHLLLKNSAGEKGRQLISTYLRNKHLGPELNMAVDVDALDLV